MRWYRRAAQRGDVAAAHNLGVVFRDRQRHVLARRWFSLALNLGYVDARLELRILHDIDVSSRGQSA